MLALAGSGEYLPPMEAIDRVLLNRLKQPPRVVCLPTAAGTEGAERIRYWSEMGVTHFARLGAEVKALPVIDRTSAHDETFAARIRQANFVYLSGGKPDYLYRSLVGSPVWLAIKEVLAHGGVLAGCSAGAMILGQKFFGFPGWKKGFGFVSGVTIVPHFDEIPDAVLQPIRLLAGRKLALVGIEGNTCLLQDGAAYEVLGSGGVTVWHDGRKMRYTQGVLPAGIFP